MKKRIFSWIVLCASQQLVAYHARHSDYRKTTKFRDDVSYNSNTPYSREGLVRAFLASRTEEIGLKDRELSDLKLKKVKPSLSAEHFHFEQLHDGVPVRFGEVIVSVDPKTETVIQYFNNYKPIVQIENEGDEILELDGIYDQAWNNLHVQGELQDRPRAKKYISVTDDGVAKIVYVTYLNVSEPQGAWEHEVDAVTGEILQRTDKRLLRKPAAISPIFYNEPSINRLQAFETYRRKVNANHFANDNDDVQIRDGSGQVFDPDPRTTLGDSSLQDDSPAAAFADAYVNRPLRELKVQNSRFTLSGPWVSIINFEFPNTQPSTTPDGQWNAPRGNNAFNDAMTYFHIDQNQRYMQSLGFSGDKGIQFGSIEVDTDGLNGDDNSHYIPGSNRMAFGHGCVDDNEDADVILHEYGHAIHNSINENWGGGDTGAMGEGFGDYWAGSYSFSTEKGRSYKVNEVFSWDGHGDGNKCWGGRSLNATEMRYNHSSQYYAHQRVGNRSSDELWSTPLFQALLIAVNNGGTREAMDQIVLEGQFGLGSGLKMRDLAQSTINAAKRLFPDGPYAAALTKTLQAQNIVLAPRASLQIPEFSVGDGTLLPGSSAQIHIKMRNSGSLQASQVQLSVTIKSSGTELMKKIETLETMPVGDTFAKEFDLAIPESIACGSPIDTEVQLSYFDGFEQINQRFPTQKMLGRPVGFEGKNQQAGDIPDSSDGLDGELIREITVDEETLITENLSIHLKLVHAFSGDIKVTLISPKGTAVVLVRGVERSEGEMNFVFPTVDQPYQSLEKIIGEPAKGTWKIVINDVASVDTGRFISAEIRDITSYSCH